MIPINTVITLIIGHLIADFVFQPRWMGRLKSKSLAFLTIHVMIYSLTLGITGAIVGLDAQQVILFFAFTFFFHWITDYISSWLGTKLWEEKKEYLSLVVLGTDQTLHFIQLILIYQMLT